MMQDHDWQKLAPEIARRLLGDPKVQKSNEWRWNNKGSLTLNLEAGTFYDFEQGQGGGVKWLIEQHGQDVTDVLKQFGYERPLPSTMSPSVTPIARTGGGRSFSRDQMVNLYREAEVKVKYADNFMVIRHSGLPMKYAPFSLDVNGSWLMKRPEGLLPLYITNNHPEKPVIVNEGEKAMRGAERIWNYDVCTWHGGATGWNKTDWSAIYGREVYIWADNDEAGIKCAYEIAGELKKNGCKTKVIQPPETFNDKDDLWDAAERGDFTHESLLKYIENIKEKKEKGSLTFRRADEVLSEVTNPKWLIKDVVEEESLMQIYGAPKSGKSFVAIAMSCAIATGKDFYGNKAFKKPVLYIVGEGLRGCKRRLSAIQQGMYSLKDAPLYLSDRAVRIGDKDDFERLVQEIEAVKSIEGDIGMIVVDTFQRNFGGGNENSAEDVGNFIHQLDGLISTYGCNVCIVHHSGHEGTRARGSSVIGASLDYEFKVQRTDKNDQMFVSFQQTLNKDGQGMSEKNFVFKEVDLIGEGLELTSGFLEETQIDFKSKDKLTYKQKLVLSALEVQAIITNKDNPEDVYFFPKDLKGKVSDSNGNDLSVESIKKILYKLVEIEEVKHVEAVGYQSAEYNKLSPNFD
jgi:5S rRNA maturation endonuclease (ribonuclease M5)